MGNAKSTPLQPSAITDDGQCWEGPDPKNLKLWPSLFVQTEVVEICSDGMVGSSTGSGCP